MTTHTIIPHNTINAHQRRVLEKLVQLARVVAHNAPMLLIEPALVSLCDALAQYEDCHVPSIARETGTVGELFTDAEIEALADQHAERFRYEMAQLVRALANPHRLRGCYLPDCD